MRHKAGMVLGMIAVSVCFFSGAAMAYRSSTVRVTSRILTGDIDIDIVQEDTDKGDGGTEFIKKQTVIPGDIIQRPVSIRNLAELCYIRVKVDFSDVLAEKIKWQKLEEESLLGIGKEWVRLDGYYYYKEPVQTGEVIPFLEGVSIPAEWTEETSDYDTGLQVTAEAVQSIHFTPDFQSAVPWGDTEIELCVHKNTGEIQKKEKNYQNLTVTMEGDSSRLAVLPPDFFQNLKELMPGDEVSDTIQIQNQSENTTELFFRTEEPEGLSDEQKELMEHLEFKMEKDGVEIYNGNLRSQELQKEISLGTYKKGDKSEVKFYITMPKGDKNYYAVRDTMVHWLFCCDLHDHKGPKTGDTGLAAGYYVTLFAAIVLAGSITGYKLKRNKNKRRI